MYTFENRWKLEPYSYNMLTAHEKIVDVYIGNLLVKACSLVFLRERCK